MFFKDYESSTKLLEVSQSFLMFHQSFGSFSKLLEVLKAFERSTKLLDVPQSFLTQGNLVPPPNHHPNPIKTQCRTAINPSNHINLNYQSPSTQQYLTLNLFYNSIRSFI
jgi:hypothetical protein